VTARQDANDIADRLDSIAEACEAVDVNFGEVAPLVHAFITGQRWVELGYGSLGDCARAEFPALARIAGTTVARIGLVSALGVLESPQGAVLSTHALAEVVDVSQPQVISDLSVVRELRAGKPTEGLDGKVRMPRQPSESRSASWRRLLSMADSLAEHSTDFAQLASDERWDGIRALAAIITNAETLIEALDVDGELAMVRHQHDYKEGRQ
jgi:hypothetical protein